MRARKQKDGTHDGCRLYLFDILELVFVKLTFQVQLLWYFGWSRRLCNKSILFCYTLALFSFLLPWGKSLQYISQLSFPQLVLHHNLCIYYPYCTPPVVICTEIPQIRFLKSARQIQVYRCVHFTTHHPENQWSVILILSSKCKVFRRDIMFEISVCQIPIWLTLW